jgi:hypothetical protein
MFQKARQKCSQKRMVKVDLAYPKVNPANITAGRANAQSRPSGILCSNEHGKLYFGATGIFPQHQNDLPLQGAETPPKSVFPIKVPFNF